MKNKKNILLLDTNISAKPIYDYLVSLGNRVFVAGSNPNDALAKGANLYLNIDYSDYKQVEEIIKQQSIDYLVPGGNDLSYKICSIINEKQNFFNIDSVETNEIINNKNKFRNLSQNLNLNTPKILDIDNYVFSDKPIIVKPVDAYSGNGISVIKRPNLESIENAKNHAIKNSKSNSFIIEEFVDGQLYSHSAFIVDKKIINDFIVEEHCIVNQFAVDTSKVIDDFNYSMLCKLRNDIEKIALELNLNDGLIHTQFISDGQNFWIIEVTRRCPGDLYSLLIQLSTGFPYASFYANPFINIKNTEIKNVKLNSFVFRHTLTVGKEALLFSINYNLSFKLLKYFPYLLMGDTIKKTPFGRIGIMFGECEEKDIFENVYQSALKRSLYRIE